MDHCLFRFEKRSYSQKAQGAFGPAFAIILLAVGFSSGSAHGGSHSLNRTSKLSADFGTDSLGKTSPLTFPQAAPTIIVAGQVLPQIDRTNFNLRFEGGADVPIASRLYSSQFVPGSDDNKSARTEVGASSGSPRHGRSVHSSINVFSSVASASGSGSNADSASHAHEELQVAEPRPDLLSGVPEKYARLALAVAAEEQVDPNWVLSIMRAENASFNPEMISPAGAIGLMQIMPKIGEYFGAHDLSDPEENIRTGTRFLAVLIRKYRNPVLIAAAYNAGEPRVDAHRSLPLIRETADYVTRVVGYYTGVQSSTLARGEPPLRSHLPRHPKPVDRAKSPMLVFSVKDQIARPGMSGQSVGPVKVVKEEVLQ